MNRIVKCCVFGTEVELATKYPPDATVEDIRGVDQSVAAWYEDYLRREVFFLSPEALERGFRFWSTIDLDDRPTYRFIKEFGSDILCRESKYFVNPADAEDNRMVDDVAKVVIPVNRKAELLKRDGAESRVVVPKIKVE